MLVGDSGQHDPEVYADVVREHPGRVRAVYIRNVSRETSRTAEVRKLADAVTAAGSTLVLASDTVAMAEHAAALGLVGPGTVGEVARDRADEGERMRSVTVHAGRDAAAASLLATSADGGPPLNVVVGRGDARNT